MKQFWSKSALAGAIIVVFLSGITCSQTPQGDYKYNIPVPAADGLSTSSWTSQEVDTSKLHDAILRIRKGKYKEVHSLLIYSGGDLIVEEYFPGHDYLWDGKNHHGQIINWNKDSLHHVHSVTKSITSACIGIAIQQGFIESVDQSIFKYLPDYQEFNNEGREDITIEHLLTMSSGLEWDEWSASLKSKENDILGIWYDHSDDPIRGILQRPVITEPGTSFNYSGANMILLGEIIRNASGLDISEFSGKYLFGPLEVEKYDWFLRFQNGVYESAGGLRITPRTMLKIGILYMNNGKWNEQQILPENWSSMSASIHGNNREIDIPGEDMNNMGYGYSWWIKNFYLDRQRVTWYNAGGWGGQKIIVIPDQDIVVVLTGGTFTARVVQFRLLKNYILPAFFTKLIHR